MRLEGERQAYRHDLQLAQAEAGSRFSTFPVLNNRYLLCNMLGRGGFSEVFKVGGAWVAGWLGMWVASLRLGVRGLWCCCCWLTGPAGSLRPCLQQHHHAMGGGYGTGVPCPLPYPYPPPTHLALALHLLRTWPPALPAPGCRPWTCKACARWHARSTS